MRKPPSLSRLGGILKKRFRAVPGVVKETLAIYADSEMPVYAGYTTLYILMAVIILLTYTFLQGERRKLRDQLPGAVFTTLLWLAFSAVFEIFITRFWKASSLYGSLASIFLAAMWLKTITTILFYGEALNVALRERNGAKGKD